ncbi:nephrin-like [Diadema antillarum]|uniref:nephrin-like n=1 Tax=Diadema antillarum TaxID=105358 RepID=UPI003A869D51
MDFSFNHRVFLIPLLSVAWRLLCLHIESCSGAGLAVSTPASISSRVGDSVTLVCTYSPPSGEFEFGGLSWQMEETVLASYTCPSSCIRTNIDTNKYELVVDEKFSGNMTVQNIGIEDDNTYMCAATTLSGTAKANVKIVVNVPPTSVVLSDATTPSGHESATYIPVVSDQSYTITCTSQGGANPPASLEWSADSVLQLTQGSLEYQPTSVSKLQLSSREVTFTPTLLNHGARVICDATHPALDTDLSEFVLLDVQVPPSQVDILFESEAVPDGGELTLRQDVPASITCQSLGTRPGSEIAWYLQGEQVLLGVSGPDFTENGENSLLTDATSSIIIQPTRAYHGQVLRCRATTFGISIDTSVMLSVEGPPDPPVIQGASRDLVEDQQTTVTCQADNGHPAPSFQWFVGDRNLTMDAVLQMSTDVNDRFDAKSLLSYIPQREDNGLALQCSVSHPALPQPMRVLSDSLVVNYCPRSVEVIVCPTVVAGESELMICKSGVSNPAANLVWTMGTTTIDDADAYQTHFEENTAPMGQKTTLSYMRNFTRADYGQSFRCCATTTPTCPTATVCSEECLPDIQYPPTVPLLIRNQSDRFIQEGTEDFEITCQADGNPKPGLVWIKADNPGLMLDQFTKEDGSQALRFQRVRRSHTGIYRCLADNGIAPSTMNEEQLIVDFPPTILNKADNRSTANEGSAVTLKCVAEGNPSFTISWSRHGNHSTDLWERATEESVEDNTDYKSVITSTLTIEDVQPKLDHGNYECTASNPQGNDSFIITLSGTSKPEAPSHLRVNMSETTADSIPVAWQPGFDGGEAQSFIVKYCTNESTPQCEEMFGIRENGYVIEPLEAFTRYIISVSAENSNGRSTESAEVLASTAPSIPSVYGVIVSNENGVVSLNTDPSTEIPEELCFKVEIPADGQCNPKSACLEPGVKVQKRSDQPVTVVTYGRGLCSIVERVEVAKLADKPTADSTMTAAIAGVVVFVAIIVIVVLVVVRRQHERKQKGEIKRFHPFVADDETGFLQAEQSSSLRGGAGGKPNKNGQMKAFQSGGYCAYNPVYDVVPKEENGTSKHEGRIVSDDGLIYAEVAHNKPHPEGKPPIRTEDATIYASLDFNKMKDGEAPMEVNANEETAPPPAEKDALIYENVTPQGAPDSP